ncbi:MAG TPA: hypothetical protein PLI34_11250, partial [Saprospiraceae bacterium]|nr:hypothetical protein [Saprospiraceae bacterium]
AYTWVYTYTITGGTGGPMPPNGASTVACPSGASAPTPPVVNDNCGNPMQISGPVVSPDPACAGTKTYTWTYTDCQNNIYLWSYHYMVSAPTFTMPSDQSQNVACVADAQVVPSHPNVVNSCGVPLAVSGPVAGSNPACSGAKTYTWTYTNCDGASANWTFSYFIAAPQLSLSCPADQTFCRSANGQYVLPQASANSSCGGAVPISYSITGATTRSGSGNDASGTFNVGQSVITWQTNTSCGQLQQCVTVVTVQQEPALSLVSISCAADLNSYQVVFSSTGGIISVSPMVGAVSGNSITGIPAGTNITITATENGCPSAPLAITAPDCSCPPIAAPTLNPATLTICAGDPIPTFTASVGAGLSVNWYAVAAGGAPLSANSLSFTPTGAGTYFAETFDAQTNCRSATRTPATLVVNATQVPAFTQAPPICTGGAFTLPATSNNGISGTWSPAVNNTTTTIYTFTPNAAIHPCAVTTTMMVQVNPVQTPSFTQIQPICAGTSFGLPAISENGIAGTWSPGINNLATTTYTFTPDASAHPCALPTTMTVQVNPLQTPVFTQVPPICAGGSFSLPTTSNNGIAGSWFPAVNNMATTTYTFTPAAAAHPCAIPTTMTVQVNPTQIPVFTQIQPICAGGSFSLQTLSNNGISGIWSPAINNTQTITYTFTPNAALHPCAVTTTMTVQVDAQPTLSIGTVACAPDLLTYSVSFTATGGTVSATAGALSGNMVTGIPAGTNVTITVSNGTNTACDVSQNVTAPNCNCPLIAAPSIAVPTAT